MSSKQVDGPPPAEPVPTPSDAIPAQPRGGREAAPPPLPPTHAVHHEAAGTRTYPCDGCGGQLEFGIAEQKLRCKHCGALQDLVEGTGPVSVVHDVQAALAAAATEQAAEGPQVVGEKEVVCQGCGGHTTFTGTLTSTRCPYCATPIQRENVHDAPTRLPVDGVLPFQVDEKAAHKHLDDWVNSRRFAPKEFKTYRQTGSFASVYASYFAFDAEASTSYSGQRGENYTVTVGTGDKRRTETRTRWYPASGHVRNSFDDVCVLANDGFDREKVAELEPWPTADAKPFSPEYLAGHLSRTYDRGVDVCVVEAQSRMESVIDTSIRRDIGGDKQRISSKQTTWESLGYQHLLLPIWLLTVVFADKPFQVFINGVTGEVQGERPYSKVKIAAAVVAVLLLLAVLVVVFGG